MADTLEIRPMAHPQNKWGVFNVERNKFVASYPQEVQALRFAFGYLNEEIAAHVRAAQRAAPPCCQFHASGGQRALSCGGDTFLRHVPGRALGLMDF